MSATVRWLDHERLHLQHGPIDCIVQAWGESDEVNRAYAAIVAEFPRTLPELASELSLLRKPVDPHFAPTAQGRIANRMIAATIPYAKEFITPMAAVAGAVADHLMATMLAAAPRLTKAYVNDGGDIALHCAGDEFLTIALAEWSGDIMGNARLTGRQSSRGVATSGWQGRSHSLGIADAVTVLAQSAATADAAATMIANHVNVDHPGIQRRPSIELHDDSDLGEMLVTVEVPTLDEVSVRKALDAGESYARQLLSWKLIDSAVLRCQGRIRAIGAIAAQIPVESLIPQGVERIEAQSPILPQ